MRKTLLVAAVAVTLSIPGVALAQENTAAGAAGGAIAGGLIAGPAGAIAGAAIGGTVGAANDAREADRDRVVVEPRGPTVIERDAPAVRERTCVEEANGRQVCTETTR